MTQRPLRLAALAALGAWGAVHWAGLVDPPATGRMLLAVLVATALAAVLGGAERQPTRARRRAATAALCLVAAGLVGLAVGIPPSLLAPGGWAELGEVLAGGAATMPELRMPYAGPDPWPRLALLVGGAGLLVAAGCAVSRSSTAARISALGALALLYAVPAVELTGPAQLLRGGVFAALIVGFAWLESMRRSAAVAAAALLCASLTLGVAAADRIDAPEPWIDYEALVTSLGPASGVRFDFDHRYRALDWPRDGRELLRVRASRRAYWKAVNLDVFDGVRWRRAEERFGAALSDELPDGVRPGRGTQRLQVTVRALRGRELVGAGTILAVQDPPSAPVSAPGPGTFVLEDPLERGDAYEAVVYVPAPQSAQLAFAGTDYPQLASRYLQLTIPSAPPDGTAAVVDFAAWGSGGVPTAGAGTPLAEPLLASSPYAGAWRLSRRLSQQSSSPYDYARRVIGHLSSGFAYRESGTPGARFPLATFLGSDRAGYCQQFAGAMAMLLRMGGVPARAVGGFSPGSWSRRHRQWVVRDLDAHSWVEAYFPGHGWVTFDPTPIAAPARSQFGFVGAGQPPAPGQPSGGARGDRPEPGRRASPAGGDRGSAAPRWLLAGLAATALAALARLLWRRRRPPDAEPELAELRRALRRCGRPLAPSTTLTALERRFACQPEAAAYLAALRAGRFARRGGEPAPAQRRALRWALAREAGPLGSVRALWALPPRRAVRPAVHRREAASDGSPRRS